MSERIRISIGRLDRAQFADYAFVAFFTAQILTAVFSRVLGILGMKNPIVIVQILLIMLVVLAMISVPLDRWKTSIGLYIVISGIFLISYFITPELGSWYSNENWGLAYRVFRIDRGIYAFLFIKLVEDPKRIRKDLNLVAIIWGLYLLMQTFQRIRLGHFVAAGNDGVTQAISDDNMAYGYNCAFVALVFFADYRVGRRKAFLAAGLLFSLLSVVYGSRGSLLVLGAYFIVVQWFNFKKKTPARKALNIVLFIAIIGFIFFYYDLVILLISNIVGRFGIQSTNLTKLLDASISQLNGRDRLWAAVSAQIRETFPFGKGAFGDRLSAGLVFAWGYSHNIFLEMIASFGLIGVLVLAVLIIQSCRILIPRKSGEYTDLFAVFFCCSMKLLVSDSFWYSLYFWGALALGSCAIKEIRRSASRDWEKAGSFDVGDDKTALGDPG